MPARITRNSERQETFDSHECYTPPHAISSVQVLIRLATKYTNYMQFVNIYYKLVDFRLVKRTLLAVDVLVF
jgi:hypothetical protein